MSNPRYHEKFKSSAQETPVANVVARLCVSTHRFYAWIKRYSKTQKGRQQDDDQHAELRRLRKKLKRVTEERDILKKPTRILPRRAVEVRFYQAARGRLSIRRRYPTLKVHPSDYYAWMSEPQSARAKDDHRLLGLMKHSRLECGDVYGYRNIHDDPREVGEDRGRYRVSS